MNKWIKRSLIALLVLSVVAVAGLLAVRSYFTAERTTLTRLSPDETLRASLVEPEHPSAGRNFQVRLESLVDGSSATIFHSPDVGKPHGTERLIWSRDGTKLLLVGRHFFVKEDLFLDNGDQLYFLYHLPSGNGWCNSAEETRYPPLKAEQVRGIEFTEPIVLRDK